MIHTLAIMALVGCAVAVVVSGVRLLVTPTCSWGAETGINRAVLTFMAACGVSGAVLGVVLMVGS